LGNLAFFAMLAPEDEICRLLSLCGSVDD